MALPRITSDMPFEYIFRKGREEETRVRTGWQPPDDQLGTYVGSVKGLDAAIVSDNSRKVSIVR